MADIKSLPTLTDDEREDARFRARDRAWASLAGLYDDLAAEEGLTYKDLGDRVGRSRAQVQRWLDSPHNMTLQSLGLLAEGLDAELVIDVRKRIETALANQCHPQVSAAANAGLALFLQNSPAGKTYASGSGSAIQLSWAAVRND